MFVRLNWKTWRMRRKCTFLTVVISCETSLCLLQKKTCVKEINSGRKTENQIKMAFFCSWTLLKSTIVLLSCYWHLWSCFSQCQYSLKSGLILEDVMKVIAKMIWVKEKGEALAVVLLCWELLYRNAWMSLFAPSVEQSQWPSQTVAKMYTEHIV